jgi:hypothetical protein
MSKNLNTTKPAGGARPALTHCACGNAFPVHPVGYCGGSGYAAQREELRDRSKPFFAYLSGDGRHVTSWTGGELMRVTQSWPCELTRASNWHDARSYRCVRAVDCHWGRWYGRGSAGVCIKMRAAKS